MVKQILILVTLAAISSCYVAPAQAQFGGVQVHVGGFGPGVRIGGGYGNGFYNGYGNSYGYGNGYQAGYGNFQQPMYIGGNQYSGLGYGSYPTMNYGFVTPRYYPSPARRFLVRNFR